MSDQQAHNPGIQKVIRFIDYLTQLALLRTNRIRDISEYEKVLWIADVPQERGCFTQAWGRDEEHDPDEWLEVQSRREPELPAIPLLCKDWAKPSELRNKNDLPDLPPSITKQIQNPEWREVTDQPETIPHSQRLENHPEVQQAWDQYVENKWSPWREQHNLWERVQKVYSLLFATYQEQLRLGEEYELVLGLGLLTWQIPNGQRVRRHLVVADAALEFEAGLGKFTVRPHTEGAKLRPELDMLDIEEQPVRAEETAKLSLTAPEDDPWDKRRVEGVLQGLVHSINSQGDYDDTLEAKSIRASPKPIVEFAPALILRKRTGKGLTEILKRIREQVERGEEIPGEFADLAEIRPQADHKSADEPEDNNVTSGGDIFFPKPSNEEQRRIVNKIQSSNGVLVQGPPGTGKSHTIANLICHLLATGNRILVTAKTPRALQVLLGEHNKKKRARSKNSYKDNEKDSGHIPEEIKPLCISLLGNGQAERESLDASVRGILRKNDEWRPDSASAEQQMLEKHLRNLREEKTIVNRRLRDIRESETHIQSIANGVYCGSAARIAEAVNRDRATYEWFMDSIPLDKPCQTSANELQRVLVALRQFTPEKRKELGLAWPEMLPSNERFEELVKSEASAAEEEQRSSGGADERIANQLAKSSSATIEAICESLFTFRDARKRVLTTSHSWMGEAVRDILSGNPTLWQELHRVTQDVISSVERFIATADNTHIEFPNTLDIRMLREDARQLQWHLQCGGTLGWGIFRPKLVKERFYVIETVTIDGRACVTVEHFAALADALDVRIECDKAWGFWAGRSERVQGPYRLQLTALKSQRDGLKHALSLEVHVAKCREAIRQYPTLEEHLFVDESQIERIISSCHLTLARTRKRLVSDEIQAIETPISRIAAQANIHPVANDLLAAVRNRNTDGFAKSKKIIHELEQQRQGVQRVEEEISILRRSLPRLIDSLERTNSDPRWDERIQQIYAAWHWAQARHWIDEYIRKEDVPALAKRARQIEDEISTVIAKLAAIHAWGFCFKRLEESHRRHLEAWRKHVNSLTKSGKGTRDFRNRQAAQRSLRKV